MKNIWFLRTDKDGRSIDSDISESNLFIYSDHGSCGNQKKLIIQEYKKNIFPKLLVSTQELRSFIIGVKNKLVADGNISEDDVGKKNCDLFISHWINKMQEGDIVFVRNKKQEVFICKITGYITEKYFDLTGAFQRPVEVLKIISSDNQDEQKKLEIVWHRTLGRKTLERNNDPDVKEIVSGYIDSIKCN